MRKKNFYVNQNSKNYVYGATNVQKYTYLHKILEIPHK